jgi:mannose-6-phosphate isomerase-like protein (cupin superfamily)
MSEVPSQMEALKTLIGRDREVTLVWHTIPAKKTFSLPNHDDYNAYFVIGSGQFTSKCGEVEEKYDLLHSLTILASPKGTGIEIENTGKRAMDFFLVKSDYK